MIDFHSHIIPGVDDGAATIDESLLALRRMAEQGVEQVITTPHFQASTLNRPVDFDRVVKQLDAAWESLLTSCNAIGLAIKLGRGVELALDEPTFPVGDRRIRLAGTHFILVEFPYFTIPPNSPTTIAHLRRSDVVPVIAHPERYEGIRDEHELLLTWKRSGACLQVNAGSLVGAYGKRVERRAWRCLEAGVIDFLCSDYHARGKCLIEPARRRIAERGGSDALDALTQNGHRLLQGLDPMPVPPLRPPKSRWGRLKAVFDQSGA